MRKLSLYHISRSTLQGVALSCRHGLLLMVTLCAVTPFLSVLIHSVRIFLLRLQPWNSTKRLIHSDVQLHVSSLRKPWLRPTFLFKCPPWKSPNVTEDRPRRRADMAICMPGCKGLRRAKYFVLLLISLSVLVWIRTFSGEVVKSLQFSHATTQTLVKGDSLADKLWTVVPDHSQTETPKEECPQESPLLRKCADQTWDVRRKEGLICGICQSY